MNVRFRCPHCTKESTFDTEKAPKMYHMLEVTGDKAQVSGYTPTCRHCGKESYVKCPPELS